jgi:hypothetical protein
MHAFCGSGRVSRSGLVLSSLLRDTALLSSVLEEESSEIQQEKYDQHMAALRTQLQALDAALARNTSYQQTIEQAIHSAEQALLCTKADNAHTSVRARGAVSDRGTQARPLSFGQVLLVSKSGSFSLNGYSNLLTATSSSQGRELRGDDAYHTFSAQSLVLIYQDFPFLDFFFSVQIAFARGEDIY